MIYTSFPPRCLTSRLTGSLRFGQPRGWLSRSARLARCFAALTPLGVSYRMDVATSFRFVALRPAAAGASDGFGPGVDLIVDRNDGGGGGSLGLGGCIRFSDAEASVGFGSRLGCGMLRSARGCGR